MRLIFCVMWTFIAVWNGFSAYLCFTSHHPVFGALCAGTALLSLLMLWWNFKHLRE